MCCACYDNGTMTKKKRWKHDLPTNTQTPTNPHTHQAASCASARCTLHCLLHVPPPVPCATLACPACTASTIVPHTATGTWGTWGTWGNCKRGKSLPAMETWGNWGTWGNWQGGRWSVLVDASRGALGDACCGVVPGDDACCGVVVPVSITISALHAATCTVGVVSWVYVCMWVWVWYPGYTHTHTHRERERERERE